MVGGERKGTLPAVDMLRELPCLFPGVGIKSQIVTNVLTYRSILGRLLFLFVVSLLLCAIVSAEIPELASLTDNTSNDFTVRKLISADCARASSAANQPANRVAVSAEARAIVFPLPMEENASLRHSGLFILNSVLRR